MKTVIVVSVSLAILYCQQVCSEEHVSTGYQQTHDQGM